MNWETVAIPASALDIVKTLRAAGFRSLLAGGCVRDLALGLEPADFDIATDAPAEQVQRLFEHTVAVMGDESALYPVPSAGPGAAGNIRDEATLSNCEGGRRSGDTGPRPRIGVCPGAWPRQAPVPEMPPGTAAPGDRLSLA